MQPLVIVSPIVCPIVSPIVSTVVVTFIVAAIASAAAVIVIVIVATAAIVVAATAIPIVVSVTPGARPPVVTRIILSGPAPQLGHRDAAIAIVVRRAQKTVRAGAPERSGKFIERQGAI